MLLHYTLKRLEEERKAREAQEQVKVEEAQPVAEVVEETQVENTPSPKRESKKKAGDE